MRIDSDRLDVRRMYNVDSFNRPAQHRDLQQKGLLYKKMAAIETRAHTLRIGAALPLVLEEEVA